MRPSSANSSSRCGTPRFRENPLAHYIPKDYMAKLEGTLLANGDMKGCWRTKAGDAAQNEFRMILMERGEYDGGFYLSIYGAGAVQHTVEEVHDVWSSVDWRLTTSGTSNVWGRGQNARFGKCSLFGSHDPSRQRIVLYKVGEVEIQNAERYAGIAPATSPSSAHPPCQSVSPVEENVGQKRPRSRGATGDIAPAGVMLLQANGSPRNHGLVIPGDARNRVHSPRVTSMGSAGISFRHSTGGDGTFGISASRTPKAKQQPGQFVHSLPGFSAFRDTNDEEFTSSQQRSDDLSTLVARAARMKNEKLEIREHAIALRNSLHKAKADCESRVQKAKMDEAALLRAMQDLRVKTMDDEKELSAVCDHIKAADEAERKSLALWNERWATEVEPFIARCEQEVRKKAREVEEKTRQAEQIKHELDSELERLRSVKRVGEYDAVGSSA